VIPREDDFMTLRLCLDNYHAEKLFIRDCGGIREDGRYSLQGRKKVLEDLEGRMLDFKKDDSGLYLLIDSREVFHFPLDGYDSELTKGFSIAYERVEEDGRHVILGAGFNPYDETLPEPRRSVLRHILDDHLLEITFQGRIELSFHSWWEKPHWKYWRVMPPEKS